jgi:DNA primase
MLPASTADAEPPDPNLIVSVVGQYTTLRSMGGNHLRGLCPFCGSTTFRVHPRRGTFYCFSCGAGGDTHMFASQIERMMADQRADHRAGARATPP